MQSRLNIPVAKKMSISFFNISGVSPVYTEDSWMEKIASKCLYEAPNSIVSLMFNSTPTSMYNKSVTSLAALPSWFGEAVCCLVLQTSVVMCWQCI